MYLLDTNVVSELRRHRPHGAVVAWIKSVSSETIYLPAVVIGEIAIGIERTSVSDPVKAQELSEWLDQILNTSQCISADAQTFRIWGGLTHRLAPDLLVDALIAATAVQRNMIVVTRNVGDFIKLGVQVLNPFEFAVDILK
ncbi:MULTISPECIES: type II toxin-antitoxin system VapC family toxin [unclassified Rhizobium]|uniref:type II toxin-antitoxin system VapC family toxin n=1 Tax=unclassified Rhizobium TaxID=2613769 RepID=UPI00115D463F|nr:MULTISPECIES: type II toxin-antitoxin system VapC family toxin [unclassified Rhizobium]MBZ5758441.1 type II toxin-antitoxin system VapC family toxin [Rhizobium sp. VS19-DR96]MBZ5764729.1 type II toxin-antitoxin system VapC family toxin [Rhizobium sp. VS19-DR129.2]MBZ5772272.1 type II toxin-antitoxin system VapC family toxin [Rhizobium sp. VS19-DRK62.2]MBZ5783041.1 type II toxin-antitoxin system VapC family toxin [Rhizobium sp. VS19-DR121]MBZ5800489.1 type II toxin-antitoxin system VapC fami